MHACMVLSVKIPQVGKITPHLKFPLTLQSCGYVHQSIPRTLIVKLLESKNGTEAEIIDSDEGSDENWLMQVSLVPY